MPPTERPRFITPFAQPAALRRRHRSGIVRVLCAAGLGLVALGGPSASAAGVAAVPEPGRAELLYETHCVGCHNSVAHRRPERVRSPAEVAANVRRWSEFQKLGWSEAEVGDVADFLIHRYYQLAPLSPGRQGSGSP